MQILTDRDTEMVMRYDPVWQECTQSLAAQAHRERQVYYAVKRLLDIVVAGCLLLVLIPLMSLIAILIILETPGPAFFQQERVGLKRRSRGDRGTGEIRRFKCYKFRTMYRANNSDVHREFAQAFIRNDKEGMAAVQNGDTQVCKLVNDARVTRLGHFLRQSSLDELPQFLNVLKGEMSLVGPRPPIPYEVDVYEPWHQQRLWAIPGVTGLWQVSARSSVDFDEMVRLDLYYIEHQSLRLDLKILLMTPLAVLRGKGAV